MNIQTESDSSYLLYCELCDYIPFSSYEKFHKHHLSHVRQPLVKLVKINSKLSLELQWRSYRLNTGVARRSRALDHVPPLKISLVKQQGLKHFQVVNKKKRTKRRRSTSETSSKGSDSADTNSEGSGPSEVEGQNLLQRFGANISVSRKGKPNQVPARSSLDYSSDSNGSSGRRDDRDGSEGKRESVLERLSGIGGISISKSKAAANGGGDQPKIPPGVSVSTKKLSLDLTELKKLKKDQDDLAAADNEKKAVIDRNKLLEKLSGSCAISISPKTVSKGEGDTFEERVSGSRSKSDDSNDSTDMKSSGNSNSSSSAGGSGSGEAQAKSCAAGGSDDDRSKVSNESSSESGEQKRFVRVKNSSFSKKKVRPEKQDSQEDGQGDQRTGTPDEVKQDGGDGCPKETGIDILERLTENLNNTVGATKSGGQSEAQSSSIESDAPFAGESQSQAEEEPQPCTLLLTPPSSSGQDGENSNYSTISSHQNDTFAESNNVAEENNGVNENSVEFSSLTNDEPSQDQGEHASSFWSELRGASNSVESSQQDPLLTPENPVANGDTLNPSFLHNFLSDHQSTANIPPENSEFMSLDRLAQTTHQQSVPYDMNAADGNTPMEQLSQQVQRMPNPTPQINVISQHHLQASPLHSGVSLSPQHISPQQSNSYDGLGHMQPPMPPPLYQGYNMYSQNYTQQTPQQMPRPPPPPMLQQRGQIQPKPFQSLAAPRPRSRAPKRSMIRLPSSHDMAPPTKQSRRPDPPVLQARPQMTNPTAKVPSGITVTPPKNSVEANKVANVLASRGITVTPAASRQTNPGAPRPPPRPANQSPILNIGSGISITSSSQGRNSGGFAVPGPRRQHMPIVNHHVERPERCTTVDLTQDDEPPRVARGRGSMGRFPCKQCGKVFTSSVTLESHKAIHRAAAALPFKCDKCTAQYTSSAHLQHHKLSYHRTKQSAPDLAIPIIDLNHPGAREQLLKCGVYNFIPLAQLQSNNNGYFGVPIIQLDTAKEKAVSNLSTLGAGNIFVLGKMKALAPQSNH